MTCRRGHQVESVAEQAAVEGGGEAVGISLAAVLYANIEAHGIAVLPDFHLRGFQQHGSGAEVGHVGRGIDA